LGPQGRRSEYRPLIFNSRFLTLAVSTATLR
jgi:hypothetical protein